ncbi:hypothetical protein LPJ59_001404 [Coemansia sp. RSA 2399]|nr:hypothetical protein LPJ59_001404 [Coemansia sp. RSA 2399]KAJ1906613.1 hypothetical protein LPJ81_001254 [Coemansia sp. IMI 209127]
MLDYCRYGKGNGSDGHDQDGYHAEVYRKKKSAFSGQGKTLVNSVDIDLPGGGHYHVDIDSSSNCGNVSVDEEGIYYDAFASGKLNAAAMILCRDCVFVKPLGDNTTPHSLEGIYTKEKCNAGDCNRKEFYVYGDGVVVGAWFGDWVHPQGAFNLVAALTYDVSQYGVPGGKAVEYCGKESNKSGYRMGITVDINSNINGVKQTVASWTKGDCVTQWADGKIAWTNQTLEFYSASAKKSFQESAVPEPFNSISATYEIKANDTCKSVKSDLSLAADLDYFNNYTYGWYGCDAIVPGQLVAVSGGWPRRLSYNHLFEITSWMDEYESAYSPELEYTMAALPAVRLQLLSNTLTNYTQQTETIHLAAWSGAWIDNSKIVDAFDYFVSTITRFGTAKVFQHANENDPEMTFGVIATNNSVQAQEAMHAWQEGRRYSKGSSFSTLVSGPLHTRGISKSGAVQYVDLAMSPNKYSSRAMAKYVFAHTKSGDVSVDKFYSTIAAGKVGIPGTQIGVAKNPVFPLDSYISKAVYGPVDNDTVDYFKTQQWVYEGTNVVADAPGNEIEELESMVNMTTDVVIDSCTMPIFVVNAGYQSPGMTCTAYAHISGTGSNVFTYNGCSLMAGQSVCAKKEKPRVSGIPILEKRTNWQQVAFPYGTTETSQCVDASDAWIESQNFQRFIKAQAAEPSVGGADRYKALDWTRCDPTNPNSPKRSGPLAAKQQYMVLIEYPTLGFGNCSIAYTRA